MSPTLQAVLYVTTVALILALAHVPLGEWMYRIFTDERDWRMESLVYRLVGVDPRSEQRSSVYAVSVLAFGVVSVAFLWLLILTLTSNKLVPTSSVLIFHTQLTTLLILSETELCFQPLMPTSLCSPYTCSRQN